MTDFNTILQTGVNVNKSELANALNSIKSTHFAETFAEVSSLDLSNTNVLICNNSIYFKTGDTNIITGKENFVVVDSANNVFTKNPNKLDDFSDVTYNIYVDTSGSEVPANPFGGDVAEAYFDTIGSAVKWLQNNTSYIERKKNTFNIKLKDGTYNETESIYIDGWTDIRIQSATLNKDNVIVNMPSGAKLNYSNCGSAWLWYITLQWPDLTAKSQSSLVFFGRCKYIYVTNANFINSKGISCYYSGTAILRESVISWDSIDTSIRSFGNQFIYCGTVNIDNVSHTNIHTTASPFSSVGCFYFSNCYNVNIIDNMAFESCYIPFKIQNSRVSVSDNYNITLANTKTTTIIDIFNNSQMVFGRNSGLVVTGSNNYIDFSESSEILNANVNPSTITFNTPNVGFANASGLLTTATSHPVSKSGPIRVPVSELESAATYEGMMVYINDQNRLAYSNGTNWLYTDTNGIVS
jgi:hypothetical protein